MAPLVSQTGYENVVAVYPTEAAAAEAVRALRAAGIRDEDIGRHARVTMGGTGTATDAPAERGGAWHKRFGHEAHPHDIRVYDSAVEEGGAVVAVRVRDYTEAGERVMKILESHAPLDIDERAARFGMMDQATERKLEPNKHGAVGGPYEERRIDTSMTDEETRRDTSMTGGPEALRGTSKIRVYRVTSAGEDRIS